ncbi:DUF2207 domain-containing protein [Sphingomonas sp.]|uniref:DUF2207 domain-containing protein n=1 Tax=Sphingomonas sp. TaxID=28214 RepID=UPI00286A9905|nr:DUF2207 domain-containing protein [Sphingomonas sp.]
MTVMRALLAALILAIISTAASAEERIRDFHSEIAITKDGSLDVTETIRVQVDNVAINHGIFRDFPLRYDGPRGKRVKVGFNLLGTTLDGVSEPNATESRSNGVRVKIGDADRIVPVGEHVYTLHYAATRQLGRFKDLDELYWNVTGNGWPFAIDHASVRITLPSAAKFGQRSIYTGRQGEKGTAAQISDERAGQLSVETTAPLDPGEGLTVAAAFPKGVVDEPSANTRLGWWLADWAPPLVALLGLGGLIAFLYGAWARAGRDPRAGTVVPIFSPPDALTPSAMRYLTKQKFDNRGFAAALVDAAVKGHVRLVEEARGFFGKTERSIERPLEAPAAQPLEVPELVAIEMLVGPGETVAMDNANHETFASVIKGLSDTYDKRFEGVAFNRNLGWAFAAVGVAVLGTLLTAIICLWVDGVTGSRWMILSPLALVGVILVWIGLPPMRKWAGRCAHALLILVGAIAAAGSLPAIPMALAAGRWLPIVLSLIGIPVALSAFAWIDAPTKDGRAMLDRIAGFKQYLSITERDRLDRMQAPEDDLQLFERFLPYAIALEVENRWADRFTSMLAAASAAQGSSAAFAWYSGSSDPWSDTGGFVGSIGDSLSSAVSSASTAPGSSSGSGGGGSSGGGGGGGGGGGW